MELTRVAPPTIRDYPVLRLVFRNRYVLEAVRDLVGKGELQLVARVPRQDILQHLRVSTVRRVRYGRGAITAKFKQAGFHEGGRLKDGKQLGGVHG